MTRIGLLSDTHGYWDERYLKYFDPCDQIWHAGDIGSMAYNMQIAFATTVVGCFAAGVGLLVYSVRRHWYAEEISNLRYVLERQLKMRGEA